MKTIIIIPFFCWLSLSVNSQIDHKFDYALKVKSDYYIVKPVFDQYKVEGKKGIAFFSDDYYLSNLFYKIISEVLTKEKLSLLHRSTLFITFNTKGEILYCWFLIAVKDKNVISEDDLYNLYIKYKKLKIDMTKVKIEPGYPTKDVLQFQHAEISIPLIPKDCI